MTAVRDEARGHRSSRSWLIAGLIFAVVATLVLVLSDDARWLRLGIVAALWAALLGGFLATHYRRQAEHVSESMDEAQSVYELELEREIAARREYELEIEADARRRAEDGSRREIDALRNEVAALRDTLQKLFGGEVLYERVALTAQSTRMRPFDDQPKLGADHRNGERPSIAAGPSARSYDVLAEQRTELIARVLDPESARRERSGLSREVDALSWFSAELPERPSAPQPERAAAEPPPAPPPAPPPPVDRAARNGFAPSHNGGGRPLDKTDSGDLTSALSDGFDLNWTPSWSHSTEPHDEQPAAYPEPHDEQPSARGAGDRPNASFVRPDRTKDALGAPPHPGRPEQNDTLPPQAREIQRTGAPGGRRRKPDPEPAESEPIASGRHSRPEARPEPEPEPEPPSGSHASGRSVNDLLAAYGAAEPPRRRRRKD